jgi:hypothetical protein
MPLHLPLRFDKYDTLKTRKDIYVMAMRSGIKIAGKGGDAEFGKKNSTSGVCGLESVQNMSTQAYPIVTFVFLTLRLGFMSG